MKFIKTKAYALIIFTFILSFFLLFYTILLSNDKINLPTSTHNIILFICGIILFFILGLLTTIIDKSKWLLGSLTNTLFIILLSIVIKLIIKDNLSFLLIIKYLTYILSGLIGSILGVKIKPIKKKKAKH